MYVIFIYLNYMKSLKILITTCISVPRIYPSSLISNNIIFESRILSIEIVGTELLRRYFPKVVQNRVYRTRKLLQKYYVNWILSRLHNATRRFHDGNNREGTEWKDEKKKQQTHWN